MTSLPTSSILNAALSPDQLRIVDHLTQAFASSGHELVLVGGTLRDVLLDQSAPADLDFATNALPDTTLLLGTRAGAESSYLVGAQFGTVGLVFPTDSEGDSIPVEITTYRSEHYPDTSRKPEVEFGESLNEDLARRDFTINAIAIDTAKGQLIDPFDGQADLAAGLIRAVGEPDERFREDPLRLLRAARFVSQVGFAVESETRAAMIRQAQRLENISQERIYAELSRLLIGPYASYGLQTLVDTGLLAIAMPELERLGLEAERQPALHQEKDSWNTRSVWSTDHLPTM